MLAEKAPLILKKQPKTPFGVRNGLMTKGQRPIQRGHED